MERKVNVSLIKGTKHEFQEDGLDKSRTHSKFRGDQIGRRSEHYSVKGLRRVQHGLSQSQR